MSKNNGKKEIIEAEQAETKQEITIGIQDNRVAIDFNRPVTYLLMDAQTAVEMGVALKTRGEECLKNTQS